MPTAVLQTNTNNFWLIMTKQFRDSGCRLSFTKDGVTPAKGLTVPRPQGPNTQRPKRSYSLGPVFYGTYNTNFDTQIVIHALKCYG